jgi:hypothetical protein
MLLIHADKETLHSPLFLRDPCIGYRPDAGAKPFTVQDRPTFLD